VPKSLFLARRQGFLSFSLALYSAKNCNVLLCCGAVTGGCGVNRLPVCSCIQMLQQRFYLNISKMNALGVPYNYLYFLRSSGKVF